MHKRTLELLILELEKQCNYALLAFKQIEHYLLEGESNHAKQNSDLLWLSIQSFLTYSSNVSKILFPNPQKPKYRARGKKIRDIFSIDNNSILKRRNVRNKFEHFDEELEDFLTKYEKDGYNILNDNVIPKSFVDLGDNNVVFFRNYDPYSRVISYQNIDYDTIAIQKEILDLKARIEQYKTK